MNRCFSVLRFALLLLLAVDLSAAEAPLRLPSVISDHAVLQRRVPIHVWGWSGAGDAVTVSLHTQRRSTVANRYGEWSLWLMPEEAGGPYTLDVIGKDAEGKSERGGQITRKDLLVGDVWVASGQSNMEMPLRGFPNSAVVKNSNREIASANQPQVRLLRLEKAAANIPQHDIATQWTLCTPQTAADFSAVGYLFARDISRQEQVPIGIIDTTWGGTPIESWISLNALGENASLMPIFATHARFADEQSRMNMVEAAEKHEDAVVAQAGQPIPKHPWHPSEDSRVPGGLYNGMIAPLTPYSIKGFLWYQGETNSVPNRALLYRKLFPTMIADWRAHWQQGDLPFLYVQISSFRSDQEDWGTIRDAQRRTLAVANTAMAVSIDAGDAMNVHPADKQTVADRLTLAARGLVYGETVPYKGPMFREATTEGDGMRVWFDHTAGGLHVVASAKDTLEKDFELAGEDHKFVGAHAVLEGETVLVKSPTVDRPLYVRYAWTNESKGGLRNGADLPASTFTSE